MKKVLFIVLGIILVGGLATSIYLNVMQVKKYNSLKKKIDDISNLLSVNTDDDITNLKSSIDELKKKTDEKIISIQDDIESLKKEDKSIKTSLSKVNNYDSRIKSLENYNNKIKKAVNGMYGGSNYGKCENTAIFISSSPRRDGGCLFASMLK